MWVLRFISMAAFSDYLGPRAARSRCHSQDPPSHNFEEFNQCKPRELCDVEFHNEGTIVSLERFCNSNQKFFVSF